MSGTLMGSLWPSISMLMILLYLPRLTILAQSNLNLNLSSTLTTLVSYTNLLESRSHTIVLVTPSQSLRDNTFWTSSIMLVCPIVIPLPPQCHPNRLSQSSRVVTISSPGD